MSSYLQEPNHVLDVQDWQEDSDFPIHPQGAREKVVLICPDTPPYPYLLPGHRYMFKQSSHRYPAQFWAEVIASRLGSVVGVEVPAAFAATDRKRNVDGALIEFFFGKPGNIASEELVHGGDYCVKAMPDYDRKKGHQHAVELLKQIHETEIGTGLQSDFLSVWTAYFVFDALIGNTDRHQDNWGIVWQTTAGGRVGRYAPAFDNGTSLGHEIVESALGVMLVPDKLANYVDKGRHHIRWSSADPKSCGHVELIERWLADRPECRDQIIQILSFDREKFRHLVQSLTCFTLGTPFSESRSQFVLDLIDLRHKRLLEIARDQR